MITRWWAGPEDGKWVDLPDTTKDVKYPQPVGNGYEMFRVPVIEGLIRYDRRVLVSSGSTFPGQVDH